MLVATDYERLNVSPEVVYASENRLASEADRERFLSWVRGPLAAPSGYWFAIWFVPHDEIDLRKAVHASLCERFGLILCLDQIYARIGLVAYITTELSWGQDWNGRTLDRLADC